jgi:hypothetical protein
MPFAEHFMLQGQFTVPATLPASVNVNCGFLPTKVQIRDQTLYGNLGTGFFTLQDAWWDFTSPTNTNGTRLNAAGTSLLPFQINATPSVLPPPPGITLYDGTKSILNGPAIVGTTIVRATGVFTTATAHGFAVGDTVIVTNNTVIKQIGGMIFTIATVPSATSFTVVGGGFLLVGSNPNFTADETAYVVKKIVVGPLFYPNRVQIDAVTAANPMVVTVNPNHRLTVGQQVRFKVPKAFGMVQLDNLQGVITAVTANTLTFGPLNSVGGVIGAGIDSTAFTPFTWPSVTSVPFTFAYLESIGAGPSATPVSYVNLNPYNQDFLDDATTNEQFQGFNVGTGLLAQATATVIGVNPGDIISWTAWRADV